MPELTLHFEAQSGTDLETAAAQLKEKIADTAGVETADVTPQRFQAIGPAEILATIALVTTVAQNAATLLKTLAEVHEAWLKLKSTFPGLQKPTVEVGLRKVPIDQLTAADVTELSAS